MRMGASWRMVTRLSSRVAVKPITKSKDASLLIKSAAARRFSLISRLPVELCGMLPLHSAIASARLTSCLSVDSQAWCFVPQGISMPL